jgi:hypothetical protein
MRYNCTGESGGKTICSFVAPGWGERGRGVVQDKSEMPVKTTPFRVDPKKPTGEVDEDFLRALRRNYQKIPPEKKD